ncbi:XdhC family protein, partial [Streptomyces eurythermus]
MREILAALDRWYAARLPFGLATVVEVSRSAPRGPGAAMAVGPDGEVVGSVSGGCVEGAVFELAREAAESGTARLETFGYSDEDAFAVGLTSPPSSAPRPGGPPTARSPARCRSPRSSTGS